MFLLILMPLVWHWTRIRKFSSRLLKQLLSAKVSTLESCVRPLYSLSTMMLPLQLLDSSSGICICARTRLDSLLRDDFGESAARNVRSDWNDGVSAGTHPCSGEEPEVCQRSIHQNNEVDKFGRTNLTIESIVRLDDYQTPLNFVQNNVPTVLADSVVGPLAYSEYILC